MLFTYAVPWADQVRNNPVQELKTTGSPFRAQEALLQVRYMSLKLNWLAARVSHNYEREIEPNLAKTLVKPYINE